MLLHYMKYFSAEMLHYLHLVVIWKYSSLFNRELSKPAGTGVLKFLAWTISAAFDIKAAWRFAYPTLWRASCCRWGSSSQYQLGRFSLFGPGSFFHNLKDKHPWIIYCKNIQEVQQFVWVSKTIAGKQLVQGCYAMAWEGVEPTTFGLQGRTLSTEPWRPVMVSNSTPNSGLGWAYRAGSGTNHNVKLKLLFDTTILSYTV